MKTIKSTLLITLVITFAFSSLALSAEYSVFVGFNDEDYQTRKYKLWGLMNALDSVSTPVLHRYGYWWSNPHQFWENSMIHWSSDAFDSDRSDHTCLTVVAARAGTFKDSDTNEFYFIIETHDRWNGKEYISNLEKHGAPLRLGESPGYFWNDAYPGNCRYLMVLGSNTIAIGPPQSSPNGPTHTRPDLFQEDDSNHANPFNIWASEVKDDNVMTDGVRLVLGYTGDSYSVPSDLENWKRFKYYYHDGFSIAESFAYTSLDADSRQIPVALAQGTSITACDNTIHNEHDFKCSRPRGNESQWWYQYSWWKREPLLDNNGRIYRSRALGHENDALVNDVKPPHHSNYIYESFDSKKTEAEYQKRYLDIFGLGEADPMYEQLTEQTFYQSNDRGEARVHGLDGSFSYRNPGAYENNEDSIVLTKEDCVNKALSLLVGHSIVTPKEVELDSVISIRQMVASQEEISRGVYHSEPEIIGYISIFKRKLGGLSILSNQVDTIKVEISGNGEVASLLSNYKHGRILTERQLVQPPFATIEEAKESLSWMGTIDDVEQGLWPLEDGDYVPVYKVTTSGADSTSLPSLTVQYLRQDTLEPVSFRAENAIDGYEIEDDGVEN